MPTEQCVFLIMYIHSIYGILYVYITSVFLKLGESTCIYVAMDLIPILLGSLPLAHNAQHSLVLLLPLPGVQTPDCISVQYESKKSPVSVPFRFTMDKRVIFFIPFRPFRSDPFSPFSRARV